MAQGPVVVMPPKKLVAASESHEVARSMELARERVEASNPTTPGTPVASYVTDRYAFAFDIDGVLIRGGKPIPQAIEALKVLNGENEYGIKV